MTALAQSSGAVKPGEVIVVASGAGRLHVRFAQGVRTTDSAHLFSVVHQQARAAQATELLIDATAIKERLSVVGRLQMIMAFVAHLRGYRVAGVLSEATVDPRRIGETMARNRGANVRIFIKLPDALAWLGWDGTG